MGQIQSRAGILLKLSEAWSPSTVGPASRPHVYSALRFPALTFDALWAASWLGGNASWAHLVGWIKTVGVLHLTANAVKIATKPSARLVAVTGRWRAVWNQASWVFVLSVRWVTIYHFEVFK